MHNSDFILPPDHNSNFQTLPVVAEFMASMIPPYCESILEPTPGIGNLVREAQKKGEVFYPKYFEEIPEGYRVDCAVMNPPFTPMKEGYNYLTKVMEMTDNIIALLPWFILINSERRMKEIKKFGLVSVTHLPRKTFSGSRIQCCILEMKKGYDLKTEFRTFDW